MLTRRAARMAGLALAITLTPAGVLVALAPNPGGRYRDFQLARDPDLLEDDHRPGDQLPDPAPDPADSGGRPDNRKLIAPVTNLAGLVDTRTWTSGGGNTYPGAQAPFGMIQWSPDTMPGRVDGGGYTFTDKKLYGYSLTHISGTGCRAAGDVPVLPMTGALPAATRPT